MTPVTRERYDIYDQVQAGGATIGSIQAKYGFRGLRLVARHVRVGRWRIEGVWPDHNARHIDAMADIALARQLEKMDGATPIEQLIAPPRECES